MQILSDDALFCIFRHTSGHTLSNAMMSCAHFCHFIETTDALWERFIRRPRSENHFSRLSPRPGPCSITKSAFHFYSLAYSNLKFAMRVARLEYSTNGVLMADCMTHIARLMGQPNGASLLARGSGAYLMRAWSKAEGHVTKHPIGTYFDAVEAFVDLEPPLSIISRGVQIVARNPALSSPVCRMRLSNTCSPQNMEIKVNDRVWELKRVARRLRYLLKVGRHAMSALVPISDL
jgi:hypothetical protein